ncbi:MAG: DUF445 domain-containing protein [Anaerovibrio sp.]|uniref:DUF445 domain-containing protein n=1 Tax=Anaerovibrio sp. TaxID=1872532 RepID=UPI0025F5D12E|nr:DUF445 domain-containing protein [Anaerovibrio sp.]MCR5176567.1 DUF445 domain-containing protein [Anaerovibrio sp.]
MKKKYKATTVLAASVLGAVATASWPSWGFFGGMVHNGFLAATIGGMADWFAVTALFRKPLGISYKTEILIKNRQRIMDALVEFTGNDLLNTDNVMKFVHKQNLAGLLATYIDYQGKERLAVLTADLTKVLLREFDIKAMSQVIAPKLRDLVAEKLAPAFQEIIVSRLTGNEAAQLLIKGILDNSDCLIKDEELHKVLQDNVRELLKKYEGDGAGRAFVLGLLGLDAPKLTDILLRKLSEWIDAVRGDEFRLQIFSQQMGLYLQSFVGNQQLREKMLERFMGMLTEDFVAAILTKYMAMAAESSPVEARVKAATHDFLQNFVDNRTWQQKTDNVIKNWMAVELEENHDAITSLIEERLNALSDEDLVNFAEEKVEDDLQMIRINGSVVGALAGMILYGVVYFAGQVIHP